jgi:hypothetical protein
MLMPLPALSLFANIVGFVMTVPIAAATWYQVLRARQEARRSRDQVIHSENCLEFVTAQGNCINEAEPIYETRSNFLRLSFPGRVLTCGQTKPENIQFGEGRSI